MAYIDGFLAPVFPGRREAYRALAAKMAPVFLEHGATRVVECVGENVPRGKLTDMYRAVAAEEGEELVFSWIAWPSKEARDGGWEKAMADERMKPGDDNPFDAKRMIFGGFDVLMDTGADG